MLVKVFAQYSDFADNTSYCEHGIFECDTIEQARKVFPEGVLCGWIVEELTVDEISEICQDVPTEKFYNQRRR